MLECKGLVLDILDCCAGGGGVGFGDDERDSLREIGLLALVKALSDTEACWMTGGGGGAGQESSSRDI